MGSDSYSNRITDWKPLIPRMIEMLREVEWRGSSAGNECPICEHMARRRVNVPGPPIAGGAGFALYTGETKEIPGGHAPDCRLSALLMELPK